MVLYFVSTTTSALSNPVSISPLKNSQSPTIFVESNFFDLGDEVIGVFNKIGARSPIDDSTSTTGSKTSYSTFINDRASNATWGLIAATAATACPAYNTFPSANTLLLRYFRLVNVPSRSLNISVCFLSKSSEVNTAYTPGTSLAASVSMDKMFAWA